MALVRAGSPTGPARRRSSASPRWARNSAGVRKRGDTTCLSGCWTNTDEHGRTRTARRSALRTLPVGLRLVGVVRAALGGGLLDPGGFQLGDGSGLRLGGVRGLLNPGGLQAVDGVGVGVVRRGREDAALTLVVGDGIFLDALGLQLDHGDSGMETLGGNGLGDEVLVGGDLRGEDVGVEVDGEGSEGEGDLSLGELDGAAAGAGALGSLGGDVAVSTDFVKHGGVPFWSVLRCCC